MEMGGVPLILGCLFLKCIFQFLSYYTATISHLKVEVELVIVTQNGSFKILSILGLASLTFCTT